MTTVFVTPAPRFHARPTCPKRISAQLLNDLDCGCDTYCTHRTPRLHAIREVPLEQAIADGKQPCTGCYRDPELARAVLLPSREDFGHRPTGFTGLEFCARCTIDIGIRGLSGKPARIDVTWPCTSAIVLGLAPRSTS
jgi:hypothetical protein